MILFRYINIFGQSCPPPPKQNNGKLDAGAGEGETFRERRCACSLVTSEPMMSEAKTGGDAGELELSRRQSFLLVTEKTESTTKSR